MNTSIHNLEAEGLMGFDRGLVIDMSVGSHLRTSLRASPFLGRVYQCRAHALIAIWASNEPSLDVSNRVDGVA